MGETKWPNFEKDNLLVPANDVIPMLRFEARSLEKQTGGKVKATFSKIEYSRNGLVQMIDTASTVTKMISHGNEIDENANKADADNLFTRESYKFEIYSQSYRFRIFTLQYNKFYPLGLNINASLLNDMGIVQDDIEIENRSSLDEIIGKLFRCHRLIATIERMMAVDALQPQDNNNS